MLEEFWTLNRMEILQIVSLSVFVSGLATLIGSAIGVPLGTWMGISQNKARQILLRFTYTLMALPPVLAGLLIYLLLSRSGPLGTLELLFTPAAMIAAQCMLVTPIVAGLTAATVAAREKKIFEEARSLGATRGQAMRQVLNESRTGIISGIMTGFGRAFAEVGAVMLVGGNIRYSTRVLTTAIVLETRQGNFEMAVALGLILLMISFVISTIVISNTEDFVKV